MADPEPKVVLLLVDDDPLMHDLVGSALQRSAEGPLDVLHAYSPSEGLALLDDAPEGALVVLSDYDMGTPTNGVAMLRAVQERRPDAVKLLFSGHPRERLEREARGVAIAAIYEKPLRMQDFSRDLWALVRAAE